jgi:hypothetical protein
MKPIPSAATMEDEDEEFVLSHVPELKKIGRNKGCLLSLIVNWGDQYATPMPPPPHHNSSLMLRIEEVDCSL